MQYKTLEDTGLISANPQLVDGYVVAATGAAVVNLYDNTSATGTPVYVIHVPANSTQTFSERVPFNIGVYLEVASGTGVVATILFE